VTSTADIETQVSAPLGSLTTIDEATKRLRIIDATLRCVAANGVRGTTVEEIASEAGMARATIYRTFSGGRDEVFGAVVTTEVLRFFSSLSVELARADTLEELCVACCHGGARRLQESAALSSVLAEIPDLVVAAIAFDGLGTTLELVSDFAWPYFGRWMTQDAARRAGEFVARVTLSYLLSPDPEVDLGDLACVQTLVRSHVIEGVLALKDQ
jgi:AcrR family transcriptional regulator